LLETPLFTPNRHPGFSNSSRTVNWPWAILEHYTRDHTSFDFSVLLTV
jgi:hypothetical protein